MMNALDIFFNLDVLARAFSILLRGLGMTLLLGAVAIVAGTVLGIGLAMMRLFAARPLRLLTVFYINVMQAMPVLVVLILIYDALPFAGITLSSFAATAIALVLVAYTAEVVRADTQTVPKGQFEASSALGSGFWRTMQKVILPQAMRIVSRPMRRTACRSSRTLRWPRSSPCRTCWSRRPARRRCSQTPRRCWARR